ncbi:MAG: aminoacyl-tRNA hydrolase [Chloroflexota bacterium]|nr:aminoacyl-tRNA hydrolase [Chloroflexota bacterium]
MSFVRRLAGRAQPEQALDEVRGPGAIRLIVGLGNPGGEYAGNRRNVGFWTMNRLARRHGMAFSAKTGLYQLAEGEVAGRRVAVAKPRTFNNDSGKAVKALVDRLGLDDAGELLVVCDHLDLPAGKVRIRARGGAGGQKGLKHIIDVSGTDRFPRIRIGIGRPVVRGEPSWDPEAVASWVLSDPPPDERARLDAGVERAIEVIEYAIAEGVEAAMNRYNRE